ncbi:hypothetical protein SS50377_25534 [Spironucleus salmonicida]|uniref:Uncharacterized protein n=1 Tax=Spironucleus salmonicida TaxID=348837 RepID=V6LKI6_9EUKA|nr:hypothetical protein SS50377_25534 [Spironucleus salmonicida]|eukprot:EST45082.1 hypothetical protein SS50377_15102 [Spironucleus salmonicida]
MQSEPSTTTQENTNLQDTQPPLRTTYLHAKIQENLSIKILKEENYFTPHQFTRYFDVIKLTPFLTNSGSIQQLISSIHSCSNESQYFPASNVLKKEYFISQSEEETLVTVALKPPFSFVWSIIITFARLDYDIIYPCASFELILSQEPLCVFPAFKANFDLKITDKPQTFSLPQNLPCVRFAHFKFSKALQRSPLSLQKMLSISNIEASGVSLDFLALNAMYARNSSRISSKLTRTSLIGRDSLRQAVTSVKGFEQTLETINVIAEQHEHRKAIARGLDLPVQLTQGESVEIIENCIFTKKWF